MSKEEETIDAILKADSSVGGALKHVHARTYADVLKNFDRTKVDALDKAHYITDIDSEYGKSMVEKQIRLCKKYNFEEVDLTHMTVLLKSPRGIATHGLVSCIAVFWRCANRNYLLHSSARHRETTDFTQVRSFLMDLPSEIHPKTLYVCSSSGLHHFEWDIMDEIKALGIKVIDLIVKPDTVCGLTKMGN